MMKRAKQHIDPTEKRLTVREAAPLLGLHPQTVKVFCESGRIRATKPGRVWEIPMSAIGEYLIKGTVAVAA